MNKKCTGCGASFQCIDENKEGFIKASSQKSNLCERCFRIKNYGDYKFIAKDNQEFIDILNDVNKTNDLVIIVIDLFNVNNKLDELAKIINNPVIIVLSKRDLLPRSLYDEKLLNYVDRYQFKNVVDKIIISSQKNYQFDRLLESIYRNKKSNNVYVVGYTNAGKSTMINKILYNYSSNNTTITTSMLPSTTINNIEVKIDDNLTLIDTPGLLDDGNIIHFVDASALKKIVPKKEIKPITFQVKTKQTIIIDSFATVECLEPTNFTIFASKALKIDRVYKNVTLDNSDIVELKVKAYQDVVILGLGFIKVTKSTSLRISVLKNVSVYLRDSLI